MKRLFLSIAFCAGFNLGGAATAIAECGNFEPPKMDEVQLRNEYSGAVLRITIGDGDIWGTGYLIDAEHGFVLTDKHVIETATSKEAIHAESPVIPGEKTDAKVVSTIDAPTDLALLQLSHPLPSTVHAVDIVLREPNQSTTLYVMNYPKIGDEKAVFHEQAVHVIAVNGNIEVQQSLSTGGDSGGPLIDPSGSSLGTCRAQIGIGGTAARYVPMSDAQNLLNLIPMSTRVKALDERLKSGDLKSAEFAEMLRKTPDRPTNLELYTWGKLISKNPALYDDRAKHLIQCPLVKALMHRGMEDAVPPLYPIADANDVGQAYVRIANREALLGRPITSLASSRTALAAYKSTGNREGKIAAQLVLAQAHLQSNNNVAAQKNISYVLSQKKYLSPAEEGKAYYTAAAISENKGSMHAAISQYDTASELFIKSGDYVSAANALTNLAEVQFSKGRYAEAQESVSQAVALSRQAGNTAAESRSLYDLAKIQSAAGLTSKSFDTLQDYLNVAPSGPHANEAKAILDHAK
ncbi:tetratricopeptide repeat-containing S1 family peptidase [Caballeronia ptereochthonis]|uniref:Serine endoprotease n=1 Tax=Caballeronia ptereochthonis TaxID=1777144 RepID=A0A158B7P0_9BURK|nr:tetratricopeptide repeat-containing serine protease family protein [Caballeronia ptereochthonis]SAK66094.1 serine endoprotease [Caballeronia ptereochthonis]